MLIRGWALKKYFLGVVLIRGWALKKYFLEGGRLFEVGRLKSTFWGWALIRGWALKKYFLGAGAYSRLGAYKLFLSSVWALIRGGRLFEVGAYSRKLVLRYKLFQVSQDSMSMLTSD